jgi:hypothetical protein
VTWWWVIVGANLLFLLALAGIYLLFRLKLAEIYMVFLSVGEQKLMEMQHYARTALQRPRRSSLRESWSTSISRRPTMTSGFNARGAKDPYIWMSCVKAGTALFSTGGLKLRRI